MRVLIIQTEPRTGAFLARAFVAEGFGVDVAGTGRHGLAYALARCYELVILDTMLPDRDGFEVLRELASREPDLPVIMLSRRRDLSTKLRGFELGAVDYLSHPFSLDELLARARVQMRRPRLEDNGEVLRVGHLELDLASRQARVGETVTNLSHGEFRLLLFLVRRRGQVVSRERLLSEVWGYDFDPGSNVVEVCVRRIRRRLGPHAPIETVRNAGYRAMA